MTPPQRQRRHPQQEPAPAPPKEGEGKNPERLYLIGEGGSPAEMDLVTLIVARGTPPTSLPPEQAALLRLCEAPLSGAELSAYLELPFSVVSVLLTDLLAAGLVQARAPIVRQALPDRSLLEAVMHGLQKL
ncbi:hypothetical protein SUDANB105_06048 [Streptomyces sp. enrichment culture]|uniref:DUF742 domain-containing protein n=1 Tax=Streptomyces sp. enrichment culture TaxID=1795815 RepID=UPI003F5727D0